MKHDTQKILIVDDRPANLLALEVSLRLLDAELVQAQRGEQALAATLDHDFALAILDVKMPGMDGYELAELLRGNPDTQAIPIIFLTADSSEEWQVFRGYESGAVDYIVKPYDQEVLLSKARVFLEMHAQRSALQRSEEQLGMVNKELEAFAYSVSHDLRAPLRAISGFSQALMEDYLEVLDDAGQDFLQRISSEASRMIQLIEDLLALSRVTRAELQWQPVDLSVLAREIVARLRSADPRQVREVEIADGLSTQGDPVLLGQVMENLLSNAWKFSAPSEHPRIQVGAVADRNQTAFYVEDNGVGFDVKYADKIFAPFQRLHAKKEFGGSGIGLSTVERIITRHGGRVWFESEPGVRTRFSFTIEHPVGKKR